MQSPPCCCLATAPRARACRFLERQNADEEGELRRLMEAILAERARDGQLAAELEAKEAEMKVGRRGRPPPCMRACASASKRARSRYMWMPMKTCHRGTPWSPGFTSCSSWHARRPGWPPQLQSKLDYAARVGTLQREVEAREAVAADVLRAQLAAQQSKELDELRKRHEALMERLSKDREVQVRAPQAHTCAWLQA